MSTENDGELAFVSRLETNSRLEKDYITFEKLRRDLLPTNTPDWYYTPIWTKKKFPTHGEFVSRFDLRLLIPAFPS